MKSIQVYVPESDIVDMGLLVKNGMYPHIAECIRTALRDLLYKHGVFPPKQSKIPGGI